MKKNILSENSPKPNLVIALNLFNTKNYFNVTLLVILKIKKYLYCKVDQLRIPVRSR